MGFSVFGPKAYFYLLGTKEGFGEYRRQRENGVPNDIAFKRAVIKGAMAPGMEVLEDFGISKLIKGISPNLKVAANSEVLPELDTNIQTSEKHYENFFGTQMEISAQQYDEVLQFRESHNIIDLRNGVSFFPKNEIISNNVKNVLPQEYGKSGTYYFDVGMHGNQSAVAFSSSVDAETASPTALAITIAQNKNYRQGQPIRLLSCNTGNVANGKGCFAQELANIMNVPVLAPDDVLYINLAGKITVGKNGRGSLVQYEPHYGGTYSKNDYENDWRILIRGNNR